MQFQRGFRKHSILLIISLAAGCGPVSPSMDKRDFNPQPQGPEGTSESSSKSQESGSGSLGTSFLTSDVGISTEDGIEKNTGRSEVTIIQDQDLDAAITEFRKAGRADLAVDLSKPLPKRVWFVFKSTVALEDFSEPKKTFHAVLRIGGAKHGCTLSLGTEWPENLISKLSAIVIEHK